MALGRSLWDRVNTFLPHPSLWPYILLSQPVYPFLSPLIHTFLFTRTPFPSDFDSSLGATYSLLSTHPSKNEHRSAPFRFEAPFARGSATISRTVPKRRRQIRAVGASIGARRPGTTVRVGESVRRREGDKRKRMLTTNRVLGYVRSTGLAASKLVTKSSLRRGD